MYQITLTTYGQSLIPSTVIIDGLVLLYDYIENISSVTSISSYTQQLDEEACGNLKGTIGNIRIQDNSNNMYQARTLLLYKLVNNEKKIIGGYSQEEAIIQKGNQNLNLFLSLDMSAFTNGFLFSSIQAGFPTASHNTDGLVHIEDPNVDSDNTYSVYSKAQIDTLLTNYIQKITPSTDNAIVRFDGVNGSIQTSTATIIDDGSVVLAGGNDTSSSNAKLILWKTWLGTNSGSSVVIGTINNSNYDTTYSLDTTTFRPATSKKDNIDLGTSTVGWKNLYLAGKLYKRTGTDTTYALTLPSKEGKLALLSDITPGDTLVAGNNITLTRDSSLPDGYTRVSYISSKGSSYLNTGINPTDKTKIVIDIFVNNTNALYATGSRLNGSADINLALFGRSAGSTILGVFNTKEISAKTGSTDWQRTASGQRLSAVLETNNGNYSFSVEDKTNNRSYSDTGTYTLIGTSTIPIYLFALNTTNIQSNDSQVYQYQIYQNDVLVANYIPCFRNSDTIYGFYDTVSSTFKMSASTGFSGGSVARDTVTISATIPSNYVTTDTIQTITGNKTFNSSNVTLGGNTDLILTYSDSTTSSVSTTTRSASTTGGDTVNIPDLDISLGAGTEYGEGVITGLSSSKHRLNIGYINDAIAHFGDSGLVMENNRGLYTYKLGNDQNYVQLAYVNYIYANRVGSSTNYVSHVYATTINASSFIKDGGTSSQFLKADGSVDSNTYALSTDVPTVNNATLTIKKNNSDTGSTFTANASTDVTVNLGLKEGAFLNVDETTTTASSTNLTTGKSMAAYVMSQLPTVNDTTITIKKNSEDTGDSFTTNASSAKTINLGLSDVASSGSYNDLDDKPDIPTVNNATLTIKKNNSDTGSTFTANASSDVTVNLGLKEGAFVDVDETTMTASSTNLPTAKAVASYISGLGYLTTETDPTVPSWAKAENKPSYTLDEVSDGTTRKLSNYVPTSRAINSKALTSNITLTLDDIVDGTSRVIPTVNNATLTINKGGTDDTGSKTFSANASSNVTINLGLSTVASSGDYNDLDNLPDIPTVNNATLTIKKNNSDTGTAFTANASTDVTCNLGLADGAFKPVDTSISNSSTSTNIPTSKAVSDFVDAKGYITSHQSLAGLVATAQYNSTDKTIEFYNNAGTKLNTDIDATAFIKDGMVDNVEITGGNLVISFNTDAGKENIEIPISDIFDASNYYTKNDIDTGDYENVIDGVQVNGTDLTPDSSTKKVNVQIKTLHSKSLVGTGDVTLSASDVGAIAKINSSTDNAIVRFDGTSGAIQNSTVTIDDSGNVTASGVTANNVVPGNLVGPYVTCSTAKGTAKKEVIVPNFQFVAGSRLLIKFTNTNTASNPTLCIHQVSGDTGTTKSLMLYGTTVVNKDVYRSWAAGEIVEVVYDGTNFILATYQYNTYLANKAVTLNTARYIEGRSFNGGSNIAMFTTCSTEASTAIKDVVLAGYSLLEGSRIIVKFTNGNSVANPQLRVSTAAPAEGETPSGTAVDIKYIGTSAISATNPFYQWESGSVIEFIYDGTNYVWVGFQEYANYANQLTDGTNTLSIDSNTWKANTGIEASSIKKTGGTSSQFLKADGSIDSNTYALSSTIPTVNNAKLTIKKNNSDTGTEFTANASTDVTCNLGLATVATSGSYSDLSNKPNINNATLTINKGGTDDTGSKTFSANASSNVTINLGLATVASSGSYSDLSNKPSIPTSLSDLDFDDDIIPETDSSYDLGNEDYKLDDVWANTFHGDLSGNATTATTATSLANKPSLSFNAATSSSAGSTLTVTAGGKTSDAVTISKVQSAYTANTLTTARSIEGVNFDGSTSITYYGTCSTAGDTQIKDVTISNFNLNLPTGSRVIVKFTNYNTVSNPKLRVNTSGTNGTAKSICYRGSSSVSHYSSYYRWQAGDIVEFVYDGTNWVWVGFREYTNYANHADYANYTGGLVHDDEGSIQSYEYEGEDGDDWCFSSNKSIVPIDDFYEPDLGKSDMPWHNVYANTIHTSSQVGPFIQCDTAAATAVKEVIIPNFTLKTGSRLLVKFTNAHNSSTAPSLKIKSSADDTDAVAYPIKLATSYFSTSETVYNWLSGEIIELVFWVDPSNTSNKYWFRVGWQYATSYSSTSNYCYYPYVQGNSNNSNYPIPFLSSISSSSSNQSKTIYTDTENSIYYNPSSNTLTTSKLSLGTVNSAASTNYSTLLQTYNSDTTNYKNGIQCTGNFLPSATNTYDLGNSSLKWNKIYLNGISNGTNNYSLPSNNGTLALDNIYVSIGTKSRDYVNSSYDYRQEGSGHNKPRFKNSDISIAINEYLVFSNGTRIAVYVPSRIYVGSIGFKISASSAYYSAYPVCFRGTSSEHNPTVPAGTVLNLVFYNNAFYADFYDLADFGKEHEPIVSVGTLSTHNDSEFGGAIVGIRSDDGTVDKVITVTKSGGVPTTSTYNSNILDTSPVYVCFWGECYSAHPRVPFGFILSREDYDDAGVTPTDSNIPFIWVRPSSDTSTVASHYAQNPENDIYYFHIPNAPVYVLTESYNNRCVSIGGLPSGYKGRLIGFLQPSIKDSTTEQAVDAGLLRLVNTNSNYVDNAKYADALVYQGSTKLQPNSTYITSYDDILPYNNNAYDLGSTSNRWRNIYVNGSNSSYYLRIGNSGDSAWTYPTIRPGTTGIGLLGIPDYKWHALFCNYIGSDPEPVTQAFISTVYGNLSGNADTASQVYVNAVSNNYNYPLVFRSSATAGSSVSSVNNSLYTDSVNSCYYNPSTNTLTCPKFSGTPIIPQGTATLSSSTWTVSSPTPNPTTSEDPPTGAIVCVYFGSTNSVSQPTLKFGSWNAKSIYRTSSGYAGTGAAMSWDAGSYVLLRYSGSVWYILNYNTNPTSTASGTTNIIPSADNAYNLGSSSYKWKEGFFTGGASSTYIRFSVDGEATIEPNATQCCKVGTSSKRFWYGYFYNLYASSLYIGDISLSSYITNLLKGTASCAFYVFKVTFNNTSGSQKTLSRGQNLGSLPSGVTITAYQERMDDTGSAGTSYSTTLSGTYYTCMEIILGTGSSNVYVPCVRG